MRILHIIPKDEFSVPVAADKFVLIKEICSSQKGRSGICGQNGLERI